MIGDPLAGIGRAMSAVFKTRMGQHQEEEALNNKWIAEELRRVATAIESLPDEIRVIGLTSHFEINGGFTVQVDDISTLPGDAERHRHDGVYDKQTQSFHGVEFFTLAPKLREVH